MHLDTRTGLLNFYADPYKAGLEEHELRYCRAITDLSVEQSWVELPGGNQIQWPG